MEDYLNVILYLKKKNKVARVKDISALTNVTPPTVNSAVKYLKEQKLIQHETYGYIELTKKGEMIAKEINHKHTIICKFLENILGIESTIAVQDACKIAHSVSKQTLDGIVEYLDMVESYSDEEIPVCLKKFRDKIRTSNKT